jgi:hypothetical protein
MTRPFSFSASWNKLMATKKKKRASTESLAEEKKVKGATKYPPYVNAYNAIPKLFGEITKASVPPKFTQDFMESVLGMKSSSHRALIPLLKKLGFIDAANVPTEAYKAYRDSSDAKRVMAARVRATFSDIYRANEYAHTLPKDQLSAKLKTLTGAAEGDQYLPSVVGTFLELSKLSDFNAQPGDDRTKNSVEETEDTGSTDRESQRDLVSAVGLSYTINLNLPATTEIEVFNAIFKSLRAHLIDGR